MDAKEKVLETFKASGAPLKAGDIIRLTGMDKKDIDKAIKKLKEEAKIFSPKRCFWQAK